MSRPILFFWICRTFSFGAVAFVHNLVTGAGKSVAKTDDGFMINKPSRMYPTGTVAIRTLHHGSSYSLQLSELVNEIDKDIQKTDQLRSTIENQIEVIKERKLRLQMKQLELLEDLEREAKTKELIPNEIVLKIPTPDIDIEVPERIEVPGTKALKEEICESPEESISLPTNAVVIGIGLITSLAAARSSMIQRENVVEEQVKKSREYIISSIEKEYGEEAKKKIKKAFADEVWFDPIKALEILKK